MVYIYLTIRYASLLSAREIKIGMKVLETIR